MNGSQNKWQMTPIKWVKVAESAWKTTHRTQHLRQNGPGNSLDDLHVIQVHSWILDPLYGLGLSGCLSLLFGRPGCRIKIEFSLWLLRAVCAPNDPSSKDTWFNCGRFLLAGSKGRDKAMWLLHLCWRIPACRHFDMWPLTKFSAHIKKDLETVWMIVHVIQQVNSLILDPICGVGWCWWVAASPSCLVRPGCRIKIEFSLWLLRAICAPDDPSSKDTWFNCGRFLLDN
jgi:hypothetical protein